MPRTLPRRLLLASVALLLSCAPVLAQPRAEGKKVALLVGVKRYKKEELSDLKYTENDVNDLAALLKQSGYRRVVVLTQKTGSTEPDLLPTAENIRENLSGLLKNLEAGDTVLVAFSGHGVQFPGEKEHYFCPMDARLTDPKTLVSLSEVYEELKKSPAGGKVLLVDACRVNPEPEGGKFKVKIERQAREFAEPPGGVGVLFSCSQGEASWESEKLGHGVFFHFVLQGLRGEAGNDKGEVLFESLAAYVKGKVDDFVKDERNSTRLTQTPHTRGDVRGKVTLLTVLLDLIADAEEYRRGAGVARNEAFLNRRAQARKARWKQAADAGVASAQLLYAACLETGIGAVKDQAAAIRLYRQAADQGLATAQGHLADCYWYGRGLERDEREGVRWYRKAAEQGDAVAEYNYGWCLVYGRGVGKDEREGVRWLQKSVAQNCPEGQDTLADCYRYSRGVPNNEAEAIRLYRKAAEQGNARAQNNLGDSYWDGRGVVQDEEESARWYRKASAQDDAKGQYNYGWCLLYGRGVAKNEREGYRLLQKSAAQNCAHAQDVIGDCCWYGTYVSEDKSIAVQWYRKAAEQELPRAIYNLGWCYYYGSGVAQNRAEGLRLMRRAADLGHEDAKEELRKIGQ
jgi:TPR repeat protein